MRSFAALAAVLAFLTLGGCQDSPVDTSVTAVRPTATASGAGSKDRAADKAPETVGLSDAGLQTYWRLKVKLDFHETITRMSLLEGDLYCFTSNGRLIALDAKRGRTKWPPYQVEAKGGAIFGPTYPPITVSLRVGFGEAKKTKAFNALLLGTASRVIVLDRDTGEEIRNLPLEHPANSGGASDGVNYYYPAVTGLYHAVGLDDGIELWTRKTGGMIVAPVVHYRDQIYAAGGDEILYVVTSGPKGETVWRQKLGGAVTAAFEVNDRGCFVPCKDSRLCAFNPFTGEPLWQPFICRAPLDTPVQVGIKAVFQYASGDKFYAVNITDGSQLWSSRDGRLVLAVIEGSVYLLDKDGNIQVVDEMKGRVKAVMSLAGLKVFAPNATYPAKYGASDSGWVICINTVSQGYITPDMLNK